MNDQRQQYIPGLPPPPPQQSNLSHLPPPPPRLYGQQPPGLPPPPPGPHPSTLPPGTVYGIPGGWQQSWGRPGALPPPPPMNPTQLQNQMRGGYGSIGGVPPGSMVLPPPPQYDKPVLSATFIPGGDSFGPGVGIPPFEDGHTFTPYDDIYVNTPASQSQEALTREHRSTSSASNRGPGPLTFDKSSPVSPGPPTATLRNPQTSTAHPDPSSTGTQSRQRAQSAAISAASNDLASQWPTERILPWLAANGFSREWQETLRILKIQGADFLELGRGGRGFSSRMHHVIYPKLAQVCTSNKVVWDQGREREEAKKLRRLIGRLVDGSDSGPPSAGPGHRRRESNMIPSASTDGNVENSPHLTHTPVIATPTTTGSDDSPGKQIPPSIAGSFGSRGPHERSSTLPVYGKTQSGPTSSDGRHPESYANRSDHRQMLNGYGGRGRHSPGVSGDNAQGLGLQSMEDSPQGSPNTGHAIPASASSSRLEHGKSNSVDSSGSYLNAAARGSSSSLAPGTSRFYENQNRKEGQDAARPTALETNRAYSNDGTGKDHIKSFLSKVRFGKKLDPNMDDNALESPTSPGVRVKGPSASDTALVQRPDSGYEGDRSTTIAPPAGSQRKYIFVTPDHWNYRLIDITDHESAIAIRSIICIELGVDDAEYAQIYVTEPGQTEHDEPLTDVTLVSIRSQANSRGALKFFVQSPNLSAISAPQTHGHGLSFGTRASTHQSEAMVKSNSAGGLGHPQGVHMSEFKTPDALQKAAEQWRRDTERKQQGGHATQKDGTRPASITIKSDRFVDFDSPRQSPYEDKSQTLVPMRKPPTAPAESSTLTKVNSLRKPGEKNRISMDAIKRISDPIIEEKDKPKKRTSGGTSPSPSAGIGAALANAGRLAGAPATAGSLQSRTSGSLDQGGSPSPEFTWSKGNMLFKVPAYQDDDPGAQQTDKKTAQPINLSVQQVQRRSPSPGSPGGAMRRPVQPRVKSTYGPAFEFKEADIKFDETLPPADIDSDDDSDDGLFAIPLANKSGTKTSLQETVNRTPKPVITVDTEPKGKDPRTVTWKSPSSSGPSATFGEESRRFSDDSASVSGSAVSPVERRARPDSFVSDHWANRPAVENVVDHLDQFFPGVDLDKPYLEEGADSMSSFQPVDLSQAEGGPSTLGASANFGNSTMFSVDSYDGGEGDTLGSDESTLKESNKAKVQSVAARQMSKAGNGLGRMKSVREVAKRRNELARGHSVTRVASQRETNLVRRKSTKMFGAHIIQIKPKPGHRLSTLDPIPQEDIPTEETPKRQATFKIIRGQLIGKGTYGRVYLGMNATTGEFLAVKQVEVNQKAADRDRIKEMVSALDQEIDTMQHLEHPNIVQYLGCERKEFSISIYLEYISGGSIGSCLRKHGKFEEPVVRSLTQQTLKGLSYLHDEGILHRDLKADNILLDLDGTCKISDFGISKRSNDIYGNDVTNSMQGSVFWMAPEVVRAQGQGYSAKVDIWSLGCVVLEMFAGKRPWSRDEAIGAIFKLGKLNQAPPIPEDVASTASVDGLNFMYDCFQVNPTDRPTPKTLLKHSTFCIPDRSYNFFDTNLARKLRTSEIAPP